MSCSYNIVVCMIVPNRPVTGNINRSSLEMVIIIANFLCLSLCFMLIAFIILGAII